MKVRNIMTRPPCTCGPDFTLAEASRLMALEDRGTVVVVDRHDRVVGILTDRDLVLAIGKADANPARSPACEAMTSEVYTCSPDEELAAVLERMSDLRVRRLPVVAADGHVVGMLSIDDIVLWGVQSDGVTRKALVRALHSICESHQPLFDIDAAERPL